MNQKMRIIFLCLFFSLGSLAQKAQDEVLWVNLLEQRNTESQQQSGKNLQEKERLGSFKSKRFQNIEEENRNSADKTLLIEEPFLDDLQDDEAEIEFEDEIEDETLLREAELEESLENFNLHSIQENFSEMNEETQEQIRDEVMETQESSVQTKSQDRKRKFDFSSLSQLRENSINWYRSQLGQKFHLFHMPFYQKISDTRPGRVVTEEDGPNFKNYELLFSPWYTFYFSSLLPKVAQRVLGRWGVHIGYSWIYNLDFFSKEELKDGFKTGTLLPYTQSFGWRWELSYFPKFTPYLDFYTTEINPFGSDYVNNTYQHLDEENPSSTLISPLGGSFYSIGLLLSFDLLERNFSTRMTEEYGIKDMGLFIEYTVNESISQNQTSFSS